MKKKGMRKVKRGIVVLLCITMLLSNMGGFTLPVFADGESESQSGQTLTDMDLSGGAENVIGGNGTGVTEGEDGMSGESGKEGQNGTADTGTEGTTGTEGQNGTGNAGTEGQNGTGDAGTEGTAGTEGQNETGEGEEDLPGEVPHLVENEKPELFLAPESLDEYYDVTDFLYSHEILVDGNPYDHVKKLIPTKKFYVGINFALYLSNMQEHGLNYKYKFPEHIKFEDVGSAAEPLDLEDSLGTKIGEYFIKDDTVYFAFPGYYDAVNAYFKLEANWSGVENKANIDVIWPDEEEPILFDLSKMNVSKRKSDFVDQPDGSRVTEFTIKISPKDENVSISDITFHDRHSSARLHVMEHFYADVAPDGKDAFCVKTYLQDGSLSSTEYYDFASVATSNETGSVTETTIEGLNIPTGGYITVSYGAKISFEDEMMMESKGSTGYVTDKAEASYPIYDEHGEHITDVTSSGTYENYIYPHEEWMLKSKGTAQYEPGDPDVVVPYTISINRHRGYSLGGSIVHDEITQYDPNGGVKYNFSPECKPYYMWVTNSNTDGTNVNMEWAVLEDSLFARLQMELYKATPKTAMENLLYGDANYAALREDLAAALGVDVSQITNEYISSRIFTDTSNQDDFIWILPLDNEPTTYMLHYYTDVPATNIGNENSARMWYTEIEGAPKGGVGFVNPYRKVMEIDKENYGIYEDGNGNFFVDWHISVTVPKNSQFDHILLCDNLQNMSDWNSIIKDGDMTDYADWFPDAGDVSYKELKSISSVRGVAEWEWALSDKIFRIEANPNKYVDSEITQIAENLKGVFGKRVDSSNTLSTTAPSSYFSEYGTSASVQYNGKTFAAPYNFLYGSYRYNIHNTGTSSGKGQFLGDSQFRYGSTIFYENHYRYNFRNVLYYIDYLPAKPEEYTFDIYYTTQINPRMIQDLPLYCKTHDMATMTNKVIAYQGIEGSTRGVYRFDSDYEIAKAEASYYIAKKDIEVAIDKKIVEFDRDAKTIKYTVEINPENNVKPERDHFVLEDIISYAGIKYKENTMYLADENGDVIWSKDPANPVAAKYAEHAAKISLTMNNREDDSSDYTLDFNNDTGLFENADGKLLHMFLSYTTDVSGWKVSETLSNSVTLFRISDIPEKNEKLKTVLGNDTCEITADEALVKRITQEATAENKYRLTYEAIINTQSADALELHDLRPGQKFTVKDKLSDNLFLQLDTLKVEYLDFNEHYQPLNEENYKVEFYDGDHELYVTVMAPDMTPMPKCYKLSYVAAVARRNDLQHTVNTINVLNTGINEVVVSEDVQTKSHDAGADATKLKITLKKFDTNDTSINLSAKFKLSVYDTKTSTWKQIMCNDSGGGYFVTSDLTGKIEIQNVLVSQSKIPAIEDKKWYMLEEVEAPAHYARDPKPIYYYTTIKGEAPSDSTRPEDVPKDDYQVVTIGNDENPTFYIGNSKLSFNIHKVDDVDHTIVLKGAEFKLYSDAACTIPVAESEERVYGEYRFTGIDTGENNNTVYYLKETKQPEGYRLNEEIYKVIVENGAITGIVSAQDDTKELEYVTKDNAYLFEDEGINGNLVISKKISAYYTSDINEVKDYAVFNYVLTITDENGNVYKDATSGEDKQFEYIKTAANGNRSTGTIMSGDTFTLKHNEKMQIINIPDKSKYSVTESEDVEYTAYVKVTDAVGEDKTNEIQSLVAQGSIEARNTDTLDFKNTMKAKLFLYKMVESPVRFSSLDGMSFTVELDRSPYTVFCTAHWDKNLNEFVADHLEDGIILKQAVTGDFYGFELDNFPGGVPLKITESNADLPNFKHTMKASTSSTFSSTKYVYNNSYFYDSSGAHAGDSMSYYVGNSYETAVDVPLSVKKELDGRAIQDGEFSFELLKGNSVIATASCDANGVVNFPTRKYTQETAEPEQYRIREKIPSGATYKNNQRFYQGVYYDTSVYNVTIEVKADPDDNNKLKGTVTCEKDGSSVAADSMVFQNRYEAQSQLSFSGKKTMVGRRIYANEFTVLYDKTVTVGGVAVDSEKETKVAFGTAAAASSPQTTGGKVYSSAITYPKLLFTQADVGKVFTYKIYEQVPDPAAAGVTYSTEVYTLTVNVKADKGDGTLEIEQTLKDSSNADVETTALNFTNTFTASGKIQFNAKKGLNGRDLQAGQFEFILLENGVEIDRKKNDANGIITFDPIEFSIVGNPDGTISALPGTSLVGTHNYQVQEVIPADPAPGYTYDRNVRSIRVEADGNINGKISVTSISGATLDSANSTEDLRVYHLGMSLTTTNFTNAYYAKGSFTLPVFKNLVGRAEIPYEFGLIGIYKIYDSTGALYYESQPQVVGSNFGDGTFRMLQSYDPDGKFLFEFNQYYVGYDYEIVLREYTPADNAAFGYTYDIPGMTFSDEIYTVTGTIVDNGNGTLDVTPTIKNSANETVTDLIFTNEYNGEGTLKLKASKLLKGRTLEDGQFTFDVYEGTTLLASGTSDANGVVEFGDIVFKVGATQDDSGDHTLTIKERIPDPVPKGYTYDFSTYTLNVNVVDNGDATVTITVTGADTNDGGVTYEVPNATGENASFINRYAASGTYAWSGTKNLVGRTLDDGEFTFTAVEYKVDGSTATPTGRSFAGSSDKDGVITFEDMSFEKNENKDDCGTYRYDITEDVPATPLGGVVYDDKTVSVTLRVADNGDGSLSCTNLSTFAQITFNNTYDATGKITFTVNKKVVTDGNRPYDDKNSAGQSMGNAFTATVYELEDDGNGGKNEVQVVQTVVNPNASNTCEIEYHIQDLGVHQYKIVEEAATAGGYTYDTKEYEVTVKVTDGRNGILYFYVEDGLVDDVDPAGAGVTAFATGEATYDKAEFKNIYSAVGEAVLMLNKRILNSQFSVGNRKIKDGMFEFILSEYSDAVGGFAEVSRAKTKEGGLVTFEALPYTMSSLGTHVYKMSENRDAQSPDILYTAGDLYAVVVVTNNGNGTLSADIKYSHESDIARLKAGTFAVATDTTLNNMTTVTGIRKVDTSGKAVIGADLEILDAAGNRVWSITSFGGDMTVYGLSRYQTYCLRETRAPEGYELADDIYFKLDYNGKIYMVNNGTETWMEKLVMVDEKTSEKSRSPKTGETDLWWMMLLFLGAAVAGISTLTFKVKQDEKRAKRERR